MKWDSVLLTTNCKENSTQGSSLAFPAVKKNCPSQDPNYLTPLKDRKDLLTGQEIISQRQRQKIFFDVSVLACLQGEVTKKVWMASLDM